MIINNVTYLTIAPKIGVGFLWILAIIFAVITALYIAITFYTKSNLTFKLQRKKIKKRELGPIVSEFLFFDEETATLEDKNNYIRLKIKIRQMLKNKRNRKVLSEVLVELSQDLSGETLKQLHSLYVNLGLDKDALEKLKSWRWYTISQGVLELTQMQVTDSYKKITKFVNGSRGVLRKQSVIAIVSLKDEGINYFLDTTQYKISEWQQLKLLEILQNKKNYDPPRFKNWLFSKNTDTVLFALRLVKYYNQSDANDSIIQLIRHKNNLIRQVAIQCVSEFNLVIARASLKKVFHSSTNDSKLLIIEALENLGFKEDVQFLNTIEDRNEVFAVKNKALAAINSLLPENDLELEGLENIDTQEILAKPTKAINPLEVTITPRTEVEKDVTSAIDQLIANTEELPVQDDTEEVTETIDFTLGDTDVIVEDVPLDDIKHLEFIEFLESKKESIAIDNVNALYSSLEKNKTEEGVAELKKVEDASKTIIFNSQSVFKSLYDVCDTEAKLILLDEIAALGDQKELQLVTDLLEAPELEIKKKAAIVKEIIEAKLQLRKEKENAVSLDVNTTNTVELSDVTYNDISGPKITPSTIAVLVSKTALDKELLSLEFCFLEEGLMDKAEDELNYFDINFKLSEEFYKKKHN
ncbi:hypothetical protein M4I21_00970 [Cellulophaga sp. 20_2_10]|uniref:hypothetical protein n=1 Tax=Cellulophaga sp. 20_2_10 TaxID=2942476 RepID=UPI00201AA44B|nr:hypothetical protein [Cellulophaga sp. 20_2_10]MCL5244358.1 hypothetical protein [Cellulophaga sp. 20_2_10]